MVGRLVAKKGFAYGIRAFARLRAAGIEARLALVGDGPLRADLEALVSRLELEERVRFLGARPPAEVAAEMRRSVALIAPSIVVANMDRESGLIVAKEAAATGLPVVGNVHGGLPAIVDSGRTGYLVPERDVDAMAGSLELLLRDPALRRELGAAARLKMEREYDIRRKNEALEEIYDRVVAGDVRSLL
jgi:glycosyltransferase involved in cell wall biosynthesis